ncbi:YaiI/YqxD family protein [Bacillus sp. DJP31]|uniref:YaiI/YqxD family protein n=1 Tax=Bacillus sp. DJP31 TaxID=3409789 RepID=UPI003BB618AC
MTKKNYQIFVDADACPVKSEILHIASSLQFDVTFVASYAHVSTNNFGGKWIYVDSNKEEVDMYIMNHSKRHDIVITQDIGLASLLLAKEMIVISPRGRQFVEETIGLALNMRYLSAKERRKGHHSKGPSPFSNEDRRNFSMNFEKILSNLEGE